MRMCHTYKYVTDVLHMRTIVHIHNVATDQDLHCLPLILFHITLNGVKLIRCYNSNMTANLDLHCSHVTNAVFYDTLIYECMYA